jgi:hypothetical protein
MGNRPVLRLASGAAVLALVLAGCGSTAPSAGPEQGASAPAPEPVSATNQAEGVVVTLATSAARVTGGDRIRIRISALNAGLGPVTYEAGGCGPIMYLGVTGPPLAPRNTVPPTGTGGAAILGLAKWSALSQGGTQLDPIRTPNIPDDAAMACTADLRYEEIAPGATFTDEAVWIARIADGSPAPAGEYAVELAFPFAGRQPRDAAGPDGPVVKPIKVAVPLTVEPGPKVVVDADAAIDAAIADPRLVAWADEKLTRESLSGATITMVDGRWRWRIEYQGGRTEVYIDPVTGEVVDLRLGA